MFKHRYKELKWWQVAMIAVAATAIGGLASFQSSQKDKKVYNQKLTQAPWSPPAWVFGPAWAINNFFLLLALQRLLCSNVKDKKQLLVLQFCIWLVFFSFGYVYFKKKSPLLAAIWTVADRALALSSFGIAFKTDKKLALLYLPLVTWTTFASTLAGYQALHNDDKVLHTKALL